MTIVELNKIISVRSENERIEFKEAKADYDFDKLLNYCVALANEKGGRLIFGVKDKQPRQVVGTQAFQVPERILGRLHQQLGLKITCEELQHPDGRVLVFHVPSRPTGLPVGVRGTYWMRAGEDLVPMTPDQLKSIIEEGQPEYMDQAARQHCSEDSVVTLLDVQSYYDLRKRPLPSTRAEILDVFVSKHFLQKENEGFYTITNLGALLFAKSFSDFEGISRKAVRIIAYEGPSKLKVKNGKDIFIEKGYASGFEALIALTYEQLPANEEIKTALRMTTHAYPLKAVREIVSNALVHQDFKEKGTGVVVEIFSNRLEVSNPGLPMLPVDRFIDENQSRNEKFASALRQLGICEERGHGMDAVVEMIELFQLPPYQCRLGSRHTSVILSQYKQLSDLSPEERINAVYPHCCLRYITSLATTNESLRGRFKIEKKNSATASRLLSEAVTAGKIRARNSNSPKKLMEYVPYWA